MSSPEARVRAVQDAYDLPNIAAQLSVFEETATILGGTIHLAGVASKSGEETICGSAAGMNGAPLARAYFELLERLSVVRAIRQTDDGFPIRNALGERIGEISSALLFEGAEGPTWRAARSNGAAIGESWEMASRKAQWELLERDHVLRSWYGDLVPELVTGENVLSHFPPGAPGAYEIEAYEFGSGRDVVAGVFAFPRGSSPLAYGFAARSSRPDALAAAASECVQRLGFLWGEPLPSSVPELSPTPDYHQEFYLLPANHSRLRGWLGGGHAKYRGSLSGSPPSVRERVESLDPLCADLTPPELVGRLHVAKAINPSRLPLVFGHGHPWLADGPARALVHPVA